MHDTVTIADLSEQHSPEKFDLVTVVSPDKVDAMGDPVWHQVSGGQIPDGEKMPWIRELRVVSAIVDDVRARIAELGYDPEHLIDDE